MTCVKNFYNKVYNILKYLVIVSFTLRDVKRKKELYKNFEVVYGRQGQVKMSIYHKITHLYCFT